MDELLQTPLSSWHQEHGAKMAPFAGWNMPIQYKGILAEHKHTRTSASLFDICHMGEFLLQGANAKDALARCVTHNLDTLPPGRCRYGFLLNDEGGVIDDLIIYCLEPEAYMLVVNGARIDVDFRTIGSRLPDGLEFVNATDDFAKIDLQGPKAFEIVRNVFGLNLKDLKYFCFEKARYEGKPLLISRTGYTGELGYEFYLPSELALSFWTTCLEDERLEPAGLGARDTLRLEIGLPLYGQDLDEKHTPAEAGFGMLLKSDAPYVGKGADLRVTEQLIGLQIEGRRSARHHDLVFLPSGEQVGHVTSGSFCPSVGNAIALAYVAAAHADAPLFEVRTAKTSLEARRSELPFYRDGSVRAKLG